MGGFLWRIFNDFFSQTPSSTSSSVVQFLTEPRPRNNCYEVFSCKLVCLFSFSPVENSLLWLVRLQLGPMVILVLYRPAIDIIDIIGTRTTIGSRMVSTKSLIARSRCGMVLV